jgi:hypothetical protein
VHEVADDVERDAAGLGLGFERVDLVDRPVDERHPGTEVVGVSTLGFVERGGDHRPGVFDDAASDPLRLGHRCRRLGGVVVPGQDVGRRSRDGGGVVDDGQLGDPFAVPLLPFRQSRLQLVAGCRFSRRRPQRLRPHHDPLAVG